jgi:hypothetical protein
MQQRKIPTIVGLLLVVGAIFVFSFAFDKMSPLFTKANMTAAPSQVVVSNVSDSAFTVSWMTKAPETGFITAQNGTKIFTAYDDRDLPAAGTTSPKPGTYTTHSVTLRNVDPNVSYNVTIHSAGSQFSETDGKPLKVTTAAPLSDNGSGLEPAFGTVTEPNGQPAEGALVYLTLEGGQALSTMVKSSGSWVIPLNLARTDDLSRFFPLSERINESIIARSGNGDATAVGDTVNDNPVPAMTIGNEYDFRKVQAAKPSPAPIAVLETTPAVLGATAQNVARTVAITQPANHAAIASNLPLIQGTGVGGRKISLIVGLTRPFTGSTTVGADGVWRYTPSQTLDPGKQTVTITTTDAAGKAVAITHDFEVLKSGTQVLGDATPSATLAPTPTDIAIATDSPTPTATLAGKPIPTTGSPLPLIILLIIGIGFFAGGMSILIL